MNDPRELVKSYLEAVGARDFELARSFLADKGFSYNSPIGVFDDADRFIESISAVGPILEKLTIRHLFAVESEAIAVVDALITLHGYVTRTIAILFNLENGRISTMEAIFDASEYHRMFVA
jgi:hypothetical protein